MVFRSGFLLLAHKLEYTKILIIDYIINHGAPYLKPKSMLGQLSPSRCLSYVIGYRYTTSNSSSFYCRLSYEIRIFQSKQKLELGSQQMQSITVKMSQHLTKSVFTSKKASYWSDYQGGTNIWFFINKTQSTCSLVLDEEKFIYTELTPWFQYSIWLNWSHPERRIKRTERNITHKMYPNVKTM